MELLAESAFGPLADHVRFFVHAGSFQMLDRISNMEWTFGLGHGLIGARIWPDCFSSRSAGLFANRFELGSGILVPPSNFVQGWLGRLRILCHDRECQHAKPDSNDDKPQSFVVTGLHVLVSLVCWNSQGVGRLWHTPNHTTARHRLATSYTWFGCARRN
jgi:hypothetical protein